MKLTPQARALGLPALSAILLLFAGYLVVDEGQREKLMSFLGGERTRAPENSAAGKSEAATRSRRADRLDLVRGNPVSGENWRELLALIPAQIPITEIRTKPGSPPAHFAAECDFIASVWARRYRLRRSAEESLSAELLATRTENWKTMLAGVTAIEHEGKTYLLAGQHIFEKELTPERLLTRHWAQLADYATPLQQSSPALASRPLRELARERGWPDEQLTDYFGENAPSARVTEVNEEKEEARLEPETLFSQLPQDQALLFLWLYPELAAEDES